MDELLERFANAAQELRDAVRSGETDLVERTRRTRNGVAAVDLAAALLPHGRVTGDAGPPDRHPSGAEESDCARGIADRLGHADAYAEVFDPRGSSVSTPRL